MIMKVFCQSGGHSVDTIQDRADPLRVPDGWTKVEADCIRPPMEAGDPWSPSIWFAKEGTGCFILCCPQHPIITIDK